MTVGFAKVIPYICNGTKMRTFSLAPVLYFNHLPYCYSCLLAQDAFVSSLKSSIVPRLWSWEMERNYFSTHSVLLLRLFAYKQDKIFSNVLFILFIFPFS